MNRKSNAWHGRARIVLKDAWGLFDALGGSIFCLYPSETARMYAIVETGGKQYKVSAGTRLKVEQIRAALGAEVTLDRILAIGAGTSMRFGSLLHARVKATVVAQGRDPKIKIFKLRRRKHAQKHAGHRQHYTELQIDTISI